MYHSLSPYNYVANNPVNFVDPDGRCIKNEQGDRCDDSPGGANNPYLIEEVVITKKKPEKQSEFIDDGWDGFFGIGNLGSSGGGSSGIGGNGGGWGIYGGGAPSPIKQRPVDDIEEQMNRKQQLEYERLQNKINQVNKGVSAAMIGNTVKTELITQAGKTADLASFTKGYLKVFKGFGYAGTAVNLGSAGYQLYNNPTSGNATRLVVQGAAIGAVFIPVVGWGVSLGIGAADMIWGDDFYNWIDNQ